MERKHIFILRQNRNELIDNIYSVDKVLHKLYKEKLVSKDEKDEIEAEKTREDTIRNILDILPKKGLETFDTFFTILLESEQLDAAKILKPELQITRSQQGAAAMLPKEILNMDNRAIDLYIKSLSKGEAKVRNIRLMIVGHSGVGKTTLAKRLFKEDVHITNHQSTDGIDVHVERCEISLINGTWLQSATNVSAHEISNENSFEEEHDPHYNRFHRTKKHLQETIKETNDGISHEDNCNLSLWDFAGQSIYYATHQAFLSRRGIYLLVFDISKQITDKVENDEWCADVTLEQKRQISGNDI